MNRDVVVGSDLACPDFGFELHAILLRVCLLSLTAQNYRQTHHRCSKYFPAARETALSSRIFNHFQLTSETGVATLSSQSASPPKG
jgi:hypothetical protein